MRLEGTIKSLAKVALVAGGIYAAVALTPLLIPYYASNSVPLAVAAAGGAGVGYAVGNSADQNKKGEK